MNKKTHANRGLSFEKEIENKCSEYHKQKIALIHKVPTEFKLIRKGAKIINAFPVKDSDFVDFIGIYNQKGIAMECKETKNKTSFPLSNISEYQLDFLDLWELLGGKSYFLIRFSTHNKVFIIPYGQFNDIIKTIDRKSIPYDWFLQNTTEVIDYDFLAYIEVN